MTESAKCVSNLYIASVCSAISFSFMAYVLIRNKCAFTCRQVVVFMLLTLCYLIALASSLYRVIKQRK